MKRITSSMALVLSVACATPRDFGDPLPDHEIPSYLPIFVVDVADAEENPIEAVFFANAGGDADETGQHESTEITVVFADESPAFFGVQTLFLSEPIRRLSFGRWQDVESLRYEHGPGETEGGIESIFLDGTFGCCQAYRALWPNHPSATIPIGAFEHEGTRPVIYVTTWNHLFHWDPRDLAERDVRKVRNYAVYRGTREDVNALW